jgi:phosphoglycolate phosphatase
MLGAVMAKSTGYRYVIWDWNGTLLDDLSLCLGVINGMLRRRRMREVSREEYRAVFTFPVRQYYLALGFDFARESFEALSQEFIAGYEAGRPACPLQPQVRTTLERIAATERRQVLLSASAQDSLNEAVRAFELDGFFDRVSGLDNIYAHSKVETGRKLVASLSCAPAEAVLVGDTLHDAEVAQALGTSCVLVAHGHQSRARLQQQADTPVVDSLRELAELV